MLEIMKSPVDWQSLGIAANSRKQVPLGAGTLLVNKPRMSLLTPPGILLVPPGGGGGYEWSSKWAGKFAFYGVLC